MDMAIGEIKFVDRLIKSDVRPFIYDNYVLFGAFMVMVPIALINLLIGIAIGDIENIRNMANLKQVVMKVSKSCLPLPTLHFIIDTECCVTGDDNI